MGCGIFKTSSSPVPHRGARIASDDCDWPSPSSAPTLRVPRPFSRTYFARTRRPPAPLLAPNSRAAVLPAPVNRWFFCALRGCSESRQRLDPMLCCSPGGLWIRPSAFGLLPSSLPHRQPTAPPRRVDGLLTACSRRINGVLFRWRFDGASMELRWSFEGIGPFLPPRPSRCLSGASPCPGPLPGRFTQPIQPRSMEPLP